MSTTQMNLPYPGIHMHKFGGRLSRSLALATPVISGIGIVALIMMAREIPAPLLLAYCSGGFFFSFVAADLLAKARGRHDRRLLTMLSRTRQLYNSVPYGLIDCAEDGLIKDINDTLLAGMSLQRKDVVEKRNIDDLLSSAGRKKFWDFVAISKRDVGWVRDVTLDFVASSGTSKTHLTNILFEFDGAGAPIIRCTTADVSQGKETLDLLSETRTTFRRFAEQLDSVGVIRCDQDGKIGFCNSQASMILLRRPVDLLGKNISQIYAEEDATLFQQDMKAAFDAPDRKFSVKRNIMRGNSSSFLAKLSIVPARSEFGIPGAIMILDDLTEKTIRECWLSSVIANRESTIHLGKCLADMIEDLFDVLCLHQPKFRVDRFEGMQDVPEDFSELAQTFKSNQVFAEILSFSVSTLRLLLHQLNKSIAARDTNNVLMVASLIETIGMKLRLKKIEKSCLALENEINNEAWQQIELCAAVVKKEVEAMLVAAEGILQKKGRELAAR